MPEAAAFLTDLTEREWDAQLFNSQKGLATLLGWTSYHVLRSKGSASGYPDRTLWRERVIFAELKRAGGKPTQQQVDVLTALAKAGAEVYLWTPHDLDEVGVILGSRAVFIRAVGDIPGKLRVWNDPLWTPRSLWLPQGCRADQNAAQAA